MACFAEVGRDGVVCVMPELDVGVMDEFTTLDVETANLGKGAGGGSGELRYDFERLVRVHLPSQAVEMMSTETIGIETASDITANANFPSIALLTRAGVEAGSIAWMRSRLGGPGVRLPEIHLIAAGTKVVVNVCDAINEIVLSVALGVAVASSV